MFLKSIFYHSFKFCKPYKLISKATYLAFGYTVIIMQRVAENSLFKCNFVSLSVDINIE